MTTKAEVRNCIIKGIEKEATHLMMVTDTWDYSDYPVYVFENETIESALEYYRRSEDRVQEVYNLKMNIEEQIDQNRAWNLYEVNYDEMKSLF